MKIDKDVLAVLDRCDIAMNAVRLPPGQLERPLYEKVNKVLMAAGGRWNKKLKIHTFDEPADGILEQALLTGEIGNPKQELGVFYTPAEVAITAAGYLQLDRTGLKVLEPSAGMGALATAVCATAAGHGINGSRLDITCLDILPKHVSHLRGLGFSALCVDFLEELPTEFSQFDRIIMNSPFSKQDDARHFLHALKFLKPGGRIVAIMSVAITFRDTPLYREMRALPGGLYIEPLPAGSFKSSGTMVNTVIVVYDKPL